MQMVDVNLPRGPHRGPGCHRFPCTGRANRWSESNQLERLRVVNGASFTFPAGCALTPKIGRKVWGLCPSHRTLASTVICRIAFRAAVLLHLRFGWTALGIPGRGAIAGCIRDAWATPTPMLMPTALPSPAVSNATTPAVKYWIDGRLVPSTEAVLPLTDLGFSRGYAAFDALRTYGKVPFLLDAHLERLERTCELLMLAVPLGRDKLRAVVHATVAANGLPENLVRIYVTGGDAAGFVPEQRERLLVLADPLRTYPAAQWEAGVALAISTLERTLPLAKSTSYLAGVCETMLAKRRGFDEVVFCDPRGNILEGTTFSVVAVKGRELVSPRAGVLPAITLEHLFKLAPQNGFTVRREPITPELLRQADEVFITSSTRELVPVNRVDTLRIGNGAPGPVTRRLHEIYRQSTERGRGPETGDRRLETRD